MPPAYSCKTLTGNWYEERLADLPRSLLSSNGPTTRQDRLVRKLEPDTARTQTVDFAASSDTPFQAADTISSCTTTKQEMDGQLSCQPHPVPKPKMVDQHNLREAFKKPRATDRPETGFGALLPSSHEIGSMALMTTTQHFYAALPAAAKQSHPEHFATRCQAHCSAGKLSKATYTTEQTAAVPSGHCGQRGELTRHPGEAGSMYGVSTFVDEYATWGSKLAGQRRGDVEAKKLTRHFVA